ncbi:DUF4405 domain-containing protein [Afifella pfennigii]|uniref:DUF4405 domain-containing protein n=1 Tax=Afifella pfennigii TaxID=209897 RepID=UPI0004796C43|nr:DUF4405 domain-containing protein [Afifella pfennigii]
MSALSARNIVTPVMIVLFVVSSVTGVMLLFHWYGGLVRFSHEWLSIAFIALGGWHLVRNWKPFTLYWKRSAAVAAFAVSLAASVLITGMTGTSSNVSPGAVFRAVTSASLEDAAPAFGLTPEKAVEVLKGAAIAAESGETLNAIGARAGRSGAEVASLLAKNGGRP